MPEFYILIVTEKYFSRILGGHVPFLPPVSYAYAHLRPSYGDDATVHSDALQSPSLPVHIACDFGF